MSVILEVNIKHDGKYRSQTLNIDQFRITPMKEGSLLIPSWTTLKPSTDDINDLNRPLVTDESYDSLRYRIKMVVRNRHQFADLESRPIVEMMLRRPRKPMKPEDFNNLEA